MTLYKVTPTGLHGAAMFTATADVYSKLHLEATQLLSRDPHTRNDFMRLVDDVATLSARHELANDTAPKGWHFMSYLRAKRTVAPPPPEMDKSILEIFKRNPTESTPELDAIQHQWAIYLREQNRQRAANWLKSRRSPFIIQQLK